MTLRFTGLRVACTRAPRGQGERERGGGTERLGERRRVLGTHFRGTRRNRRGWCTTTRRAVCENAWVVHTKPYVSVVRSESTRWRDQRTSPAAEGFACASTSDRSNTGKRRGADRVGRQVAGLAGMRSALPLPITTPRRYPTIASFSSPPPFHPRSPASLPPATSLCLSCPPVRSPFPYVELWSGILRYSMAFDVAFVARLADATCHQTMTRFNVFIAVSAEFL